MFPTSKKNEAFREMIFPSQIVKRGKQGYGAVTKVIVGLSADVSHSITANANSEAKTEATISVPAVIPIRCRA